MSGSFKITWAPNGKTATCKANPAYPEGVDLDPEPKVAIACSTALPYPAPACGTHIVECLICGLRVAVTAAGRPDDPRSLRLPCMLQHA
jgi:hypothetical protein